jgi:flagellar hook-associated protein 1 FlgK
VQVAGIESLRDRVLELRIQSQLQQQLRDENFVQAMRPIELLFPSDGTGLDSAINAFFNKIQSLTAAPTDRTQRVGVLMAGERLAASFRSISSNLAGAKQNLELGITQSVQEINRVAAEIAAVNAEVAARQQIGQPASDALDRRTLLMRQLSGLVNFSTVDTENGLTLTTSDGAPLVVADRNYQLTIVRDPEGNSQIYSEDDLVTGSITGGKLGGLLAVRDEQILKLGNDLDQLAFALANRVNEVNRNGFDLAGSPGVNLFEVGPSSSGAAQVLKLLISDPALIAASAEQNSAGDNTNLNALLAVASSPLVNGLSATEAYASTVFQLGFTIANTVENAEAGDLVVQQLDNQRNAISGVSLDEEAANLIQFQRAYQAAARVVNVTNELLDTVINLGRR